LRTGTVLVAIACFVWGVIGVAAILVGVGTADAADLALVSGTSLVVPGLAGVLLLRAGMPVGDVASWAVPSWMAHAIALSFPVFPASLVPFVIGIGVPTLMIFSQSARGLWYRHILRAPDRAR
jgi:hypothetical protein